VEVSKILRHKLLGGPSPPSKYWGDHVPRPLLIDAYGYTAMNNKKDDYRQRNVRQFLQAALRHILVSLGTPLGQSR